MEKKKHYCALIAAFVFVLLAACAPEQKAVPAALTQPPAPTQAPATAATSTPEPTSPPATEPPAAGRSNASPLPIRLQYGEFDPLAGEPALPDDLRLDAYPGEEGYYILQFDGPILDEWQKALDATGAQRLGYVPEFAYLLRMTPAQKEAAAALPHVRWVGLYQPGYKISPALADAFVSRGKVTVVTFSGVDFDAIKNQITQIGGVIEESSLNDQFGSIRTEIDKNQLVPLARLPGVMWIEPWTAPALH